MSVTVARAPVAPATIVLAARVATRRIAYGRTLESAGHAVVLSHDPARLVNAARQAAASVVVLDLALTQSDTLSCIRMLKRNPQTRQAQILVLCRPATDRAEVRELTAAGAFEVAVDPLDEAALLTRVERALQFAPEPKNEQHTSSATSHVPGHASLLMRPLRCNFHAEQQPFSYYLLRAGRVAVDTNFHDVPVYAPASDGPFVDYHILSVIVCPICFFASADPDYFVQPGNVRAEPFAFDAPTRATIAATLPARRQLAAGFGRAFTTHERSVRDGLLAHDLAIVTAQTLAKDNLHSFTRELVRIGNYHLRAALLAQQSGAAAELVMQRQRTALESLKDAYIYVAGPTYYRNAYQIIALAISFGDDATAYQFLARLRDAVRAQPAVGDERALQERYMALAQKAWEDREYHRA